MTRREYRIEPGVTKRGVLLNGLNVTLNTTNVILKTTDVILNLIQDPRHRSANPLDAESSPA
ncbi:MAG: hypothetical protein QHI38_05840 [Armatimonadota bacterium]|nr:hypothetical protein [Armatimonadota bacterium]